MLRTTTSLAAIVVAARLAASARAAMSHPTRPDPDRASTRQTLWCTIVTR
jgi:hypothetical protein